MYVHAHVHMYVHVYQCRGSVERKVVDVGVDPTLMGIRGNRDTEIKMSMMSMMKTTDVCKHYDCTYLLDHSH